MARENFSIGALYNRITDEISDTVADLFNKSLMTGEVHRIHRIHRRQHVSEDDAGISKHRLSSYNAYYHN